MAGYNALTDDLKSYTCPVCMEIFDTPTVLLNCSHTFCKNCLDQCLRQQEFQHGDKRFQQRDSRSQQWISSCPICRKPFGNDTTAIDRNLVEFFNHHYYQCTGCKQQILMASLRQHLAHCEEFKLNESKNVQNGKFSGPKVDVPNRHTFRCPYCTMDHLDQQEFVKHCVTSHRGDRTAVVCPICSSMPWGDPNYRSANFIQHLQARHQFEYDTYVDYQLDDEAMMRSALSKSMMEK